MSRPRRYVVQRLSASSRATWRTVFQSDQQALAEARYLSHATSLPRGASVRLVDTVHYTTLASASG